MTDPDPAADPFGDTFVVLHADEAALIADLLAALAALLGVGLSAAQQTVLRVIPPLADPELVTQLVAVITSQLTDDT